MLIALLGEFERGFVSGAQALAALQADGQIIGGGFSAEAQAEAQALAALVKPHDESESISLGGFLTLTNVGATYDATAASRGLGITAIETEGIISVTFGVRVNHVGGGTQSWQLWNETDGAEIAVIDDTGVGDNKLLSTTVTLGAPLAAGVKIVRVRAKSTTAADDPVYYGGGLIVRRRPRLTSEAIHEVLLLAEARIAPYDDPAAVRARLGL